MGRLGNWWNRAGFLYVNRLAAESLPGLFVLCAPHWFFVVLTGLLPAFWFAHRRRLKRVAQHLRMNRCPACGYDLRATPARGPECGAVPAAPAAR